MTDDFVPKEFTGIARAFWQRIMNQVELGAESHGRVLLEIQKNLRARPKRLMRHDAFLTLSRKWYNQGNPLRLSFHREFNKGKFKIVDRYVASGYQTAEHWQQQVEPHITLVVLEISNQGINIEMPATISLRALARWLQHATEPSFPSLCRDLHPLIENEEKETHVFTPDNGCWVGGYGLTELTVTKEVERKYGAQLDAMEQWAEANALTCLQKPIFNVRTFVSSPMIGLRTHRNGEVLRID
jgi:hypothetical protein